MIHNNFHQKKNNKSITDTRGREVGTQQEVGEDRMWVGENRAGRGGEVGNSSLVEEQVANWLFNLIYWVFLCPKDSEM